MLSCPSRGTWIEMITRLRLLTVWRMSCPSRGTWIEMVWQASTPKAERVVPLTGHVDRNSALLI